MIVGSRRKQNPKRGEPCARTTPQEKPLPPVLAQRSLLLPSQKTAAASDPERLAGGRREEHKGTSGRPSTLG